MARDRSEFSQIVRAERKIHANNCCETCGIDLTGKKAEYDHLIPDRLGGKPTFANCRILCEDCHAKKTGTEDIPRIAKMKRQAIASAGVKDPSSHPIPSPPRAHKQRAHAGRQSLPPRQLYEAAE